MDLASSVGISLFLMRRKLRRVGSNEKNQLCRTYAVCPCEGDTRDVTEGNVAAYLRAR